jgi:hypothetical protein
MEQECPVVELRQYTTHPGTRDTLVRVFEDHLTLARLVTKPARNGYPRLPVREDANVMVSFASHASADNWKPAAIVSPAVARVEHLRLAPTRRSFLRHPPLL